jgi:hypothetical protein
MPPIQIRDRWRVPGKRRCHAVEGNTGQSRIVASLLLASWNAEQNGLFDLTDLWGADTSITVDIPRQFVGGDERDGAERG